MVSTRTSKDKMERTVPVIRLEKDADLKKLYTFGRKLGQGSFGVVYEATHTETQTKWAIKEICKPAPGSSKWELLDNEINILKQVNHNHIIHLKEVYFATKMVYLVTELCVGGDLRQLLNRKKYLTEDETKHIICCLADAFVYLHRKNIAHRDLKLGNILVKNSVDEEESREIDIKVTDFGLSVQTAGVSIEHIMTGTCGTSIFMAPEVMNGEGYTHWCDIWSIGVVMYMLLCGEPPFVSRKKTGYEEFMTKEVKFTQPIWGTVSDAAKTILSCLLKVNPAYRMSANQLLERPWITGDTNVPELPINVLELMRQVREEQERKQAEEDLSVNFFDGKLDPPETSKAASTKAESDCSGLAKPKPFNVKKVSTSDTSDKQTNDSGGSIQYNKHKFDSEKPGPSQPSHSQCHAGVKPSTQPSVKQKRPQDKKDVSAGQKPAPDDNRPTSSFKSRNTACNHKKEKKSDKVK